MRGNSIADNAQMFAPLLCPGWMGGLHGEARNRSFNPSTTFWAWIDQLLDSNASCSKAVARVQAWCAENGRDVPSSATGAYCAARNRLPGEFIGQIQHRITGAMRARRRTMDLWRGMVLKAVDGSSVQLMDTPENQRTFPQSSSQKPGCGFPIMAFAGVLDLSCGGWLGVATGPAHTHDTKLAGRLMKHFEPGDLVLADRAFNSYEMVARLQQQGAESLMRLNQARHRALDWKAGKKLGRNERLFCWQKPSKAPSRSSLSQEDWEALPATLQVRLIRFDYENRGGAKATMILATTLLDPLLYPWAEMAEVYALRWDIELKLRDLKTTLGMERFHVRSPELARKTLSMVMVAHNLIRSMVQLAAIAEGLALSTLSFKGSLDLLRAWQGRYRGRDRHHQVRSQIHEELLSLIATKRIDPRPFRHEPRALKRRPKPFAL